MQRKHTLCDCSYEFIQVRTKGFKRDALTFIANALRGTLDSEKVWKLTRYDNSEHTKVKVWHSHDGSNIKVASAAIAQAHSLGDHW